MRLTRLALARGRAGGQDRVKEVGDERVHGGFRSWVRVRVKGLGG